MDIVPLTGGLGAEILGADLNDASQFAAIKAAFITYSVITVRAQSLTPDDLLRFAKGVGGHQCKPLSLPRSLPIPRSRLS